MKYEDFQLEDFLADEFFVRWVRYPDTESELFWKLWLTEYPEKRKLISLAREIVITTTYRHQRTPDKKDYREVLENVFSPEKMQKGISSYERPKRNNWKVAAAIALLFVATFYIYLYLEPQTNSPTKDAPTAQVAQIMLSKEIPAGQKYTLVFEDGSKVKLNAASAIRFPEHFSKGERKVYLNGEGFFEIVRDTSRPFIVVAGDVATEVLGTSFNVRAYQDEGEIAIALVEGSVKVKDSKSANTVLQPSEMAVFDKQSENFATMLFEPMEIIGWKEGVIHFRKASMEQIKSKLEKWYGVKITLQGDTNIEGYNGEFNNESLETVLQGLSFSIGFDYVRTRDIVKITMQ